MSTADKGTVLVVDDSPSTVTLVRATLEQAGYQVLVATSGEKALPRVALVKPDLILLDILMPGMDGFEICAQLKARKAVRHIPVIFLSALAETFDKVKGFELGAVDYLIKPIAPAELLARVRTHVTTSHLKMELRAANKYLEERVAARTADLSTSNCVLQLEIAERRRAEEERTRLEQQLRQAQKMEAIGTFAGGVAHDFNNILTTIIGQGEILSLKMGENNPLISYVEDILAASERAVSITQSLLNFSRKPMISLQPLNLNEILRRFESFLLKTIRENITLKILCADEDLTIMGHSGQIEQVLMNLAANGRDAMPGGGVLVVKTERDFIRKEILSSYDCLKPGAYAVISVSDTGEGMDEVTKQRIFEPFFTTKQMGKGTGLGLSIVYGIIEQHKGTITVYSDPGKGTTFKIYLKLIES